MLRLIIGLLLIQSILCQQIGEFCSPGQQCSPMGSVCGLQTADGTFLCCFGVLSPNSQGGFQATCTSLAGQQGSCEVRYLTNPPFPGAPTFKNDLCSSKVCNVIDANNAWCRTQTSANVFDAPLPSQCANDGVDTSYCAGTQTLGSVGCGQVITSTTKAGQPGCTGCVFDRTYCCTSGVTVSCTTINPLFGGICCVGMPTGSICTAHWQCASGTCAFIASPPTFNKCL